VCVHACVCMDLFDNCLERVVRHLRWLPNFMLILPSHWWFMLLFSKEKIMYQLFHGMVMPTTLLWAQVPLWPHTLCQCNFVIESVPRIAMNQQYSDEQIMFPSLLLIKYIHCAAYWTNLCNVIKHTSQRNVSIPYRHAVLTSRPILNGDRSAMNL